MSHFMFELSKRNINCSIFLSKEGTIGMLSRYIFASESFQDKATQICELLNETEDLLNCSRFNGTRDQCRMCQCINKFREKTMNQALAS